MDDKLPTDLLKLQWNRKHSDIINIYNSKSQNTQPPVLHIFNWALYKTFANDVNLEFTSTKSSCSTQDILKKRLHLLKRNAVLSFHFAVRQFHDITNDEHHKLYTSESAHSSPKVLLKQTQSKEHNILPTKTMLQILYSSVVSERSYGTHSI